MSERKLAARGPQIALAVGLIAALGLAAALGLPRSLGAAPPADSAKAPGAAPASGGTRVQAIDGSALKQAIAAQRGKVVVVDLWATTCGPYVEEFPDLVKLYNLYHSKGLVVIAASLDEPEDKPKVVAFVAKQKAAFPVYVRLKGNPEAFINPMDKNWTGALPTTYLFDRSGKQVGDQRIGGMPYPELEAAIKPLLN